MLAVVVAVIVLDKLLWGGLSFVFDKVAQAVDAELNDSDRLREELLAAQMRYELGEIDDAELARVESDLLARLREIKQEEEAAGAPTGAISFGGGAAGGVEVGFEGEEHEAMDPRGEGGEPGS